MSQPVARPRSDLPGGGAVTEKDPKTGLPVEKPPAADLAPPGGAPGDDQGAQRAAPPAAATPPKPGKSRAQQEREELQLKAKERRERIVAEQDKEQPDAAAMDRTAEAEMRGEILHPGEKGYVPPAEPVAAATTAGDGTQIKTQPVAGKPIDTAGEMTTVKVYGVERQVPTAVVEAAGGRDAYQKKLAAEEREASSNAERQRLDTERQRQANKDRELSEREAAIRRGESVTPPPIPGAGADRKAQAAALVERLYSGDAAKAAAAVEEILSAAGSGHAQMTPQQIADEVERKLEQREAARTARTAEDQREAARVSANTAFKTAFPELAKDESKTVYAQQILKRIIADPANNGRPLELLVIEAGNEAMSDFGLKAPAPAVAAPVALTQELDRRDNAKRLGPFAGDANVRQAAPAETTRPRTRAEVVAQMRKDRGLPPGG